MTADQEERILMAARNLVAALNSCDESVTLEHTEALRQTITSEKPTWRHRIDIRFHRTLSVGSDQE